MKNYLFHLAILVCLSYSSFAQSYNCFQTHQKLFFTNDEGYLRGMRIDSVVHFGSDSVYYPFHTPRRKGYLFASSNVFDSTGASWLGKKVIRKPDGTFLFDNIWGDTVQINSLANVGDSWIFFDDTTNISYLASVTSKDTMTILGVIDSIKTITITADSAGISNPIDPVNNFKILLSKHFGFINVFDLYTFPYHYPDSFRNIRHIDYYLDLLLGNLGEGDLGWHHDRLPNVGNSIFHLVDLHNPKMNEIYSFAVGDVFESSREETNLINGNFSIITKIDTLLSKVSVGQDTIYQFDEDIITFSLVTMGSTIITSNTYSHPPSSIRADTMQLMNLNTMPEEWRAGYFYHYFQPPAIATTCYSPASYWVNSENIYYDGNMLSGIGTDGMQIQFSYYMTGYKIGYGIDTISEFNATSQRTIDQQQFYAYKSGTSCFGTIWPITEVREITPSHPEFYFAPNPVNSVLTIKTDYKEDYLVVLSNLLGQIIKQFHCNSNEEKLDVTQLPNGLYILTVLGRNEFRETTKLIIEH